MAWKRHRSPWERLKIVRELASGHKVYNYAAQEIAVQAVSKKLQFMNSSCKKKYYGSPTGENGSKSYYFTDRFPQGKPDVLEEFFILRIKKGGCSGNSFFIAVIHVIRSEYKAVCHEGRNAFENTSVLLRVGCQYVHRDIPYTAAKRW